MDYNKEIFENNPELEAAYQQIKKNLTRGLTPVEHPVSVVLGGLPGAGKGNIYGIYDEKTNENIVKIDCDSFRRYHPQCVEFYEKFGEESALHTNDFVFAVSDRLVDELSKEKYNMIYESALKSPKTAFRHSAELKDLGYRVELAVMGTSADVASQGKEQRFLAAKEKYERDKANGVPDSELDPPRSVGDSFFNEVKGKIVNSLNMVYRGINEQGQKVPTVDDIYIVNRNRETLYHMAETPSVNPSLVFDSLLHNRAANLSDSTQEIIINESQAKKIQTSDYPYSIKMSGKNLVVSVNTSDVDEVKRLIQPTVIVYAGANGSGKSTFKECLGKDGVVGAYINADNIKAAMVCSDIAAATQAEKMRENALSQKADFTFETVLSTERNMNLLQKAKENGYFVKSFFLLTNDVNVNFARVAVRQNQGGHGVPQDKIAKRYPKTLENLPELIKTSDFCEVWDNTDNPHCIFKKEGNKFTLSENEFWSKDKIMDITKHTDFDKMKLLPAKTENTHINNEPPKPSIKRR